MKNIFSLGLLILVMSFISCQKESLEKVDNESINKVTIQQLKSDLLEINQKYISNNRVNWRHWAGVAAADLTAGAAGAEYGACCPPYGPLIGGGILGGLASYAVGGIASPDGQNNVIVNNLLQYDVSYQLPNPNSNPFDITVGRRHNEILKALILADSFQYSNIENCINYEIGLSTQEQSFYSSNQLYFLNAFSEFYNLQNITTENVNFVGETLIGDSLLFEIVSNYGNGLNSINYSDVLNLSYDYENYIINSQLNWNTKQNALAGISVGKYSSKFWFENL